ANDSSAANAVSTPEPSTLTLSVAGVCGLLFLRRQRTRLGQINCGVDRRDKWTGLVLEDAVTWLGEEQELGIAQFPSEVAN
ncbi:MAG: PEP-CTERM sorting domain-containing protein, partial [Planctomycetia bacterium]|nr:PEP-CTERM sorting domain-containing protein [Planctomycetia bacterium]